jgi:hypothetical protein
MKSCGVKNRRGGSIWVGKKRFMYLGRWNTKVNVMTGRNSRTVHWNLLCTKMAVFWVVALMMEAARSSETLVNFYQTTRCYNPEDSPLRTNRRENLKSYLVLMGPDYTCVFWARGWRARWYALRAHLHTFCILFKNMRSMSSGLLRRVVWQKFTDVSEVLAAFITWAIIALMTDNRQ